MYPLRTVKFFNNTYDTVIYLTSQQMYQSVINSLFYRRTVIFVNFKGCNEPRIKILNKYKYALKKKSKR